MPRSGRSGLNVVRKHRADGSIVEYFYNAKTKEFLGHDREAAKVRVPGAAAAPDDSIAALIAWYKGSPKFTKRKPGTQVLYTQYLDQIQAGYGHLPARDITYDTIEAIKDSLVDHPAKLRMVLVMLRILLKRAVKRKFVRENVASRPELEAPPPRKTIWTLEEEVRFIACARPSLRLAFSLLLHTLQRPSDVLAMTTARVSEQNGRLFIAVKQGKTDELLDVPVHSALAPLLRERLAENRPGYLVSAPRGGHWSRRNMARCWDQAKREAGLTGVQRRDLRRTGIVRLAQAGATTPQIAAISGHAIDYCQRIIDTYLPKNTKVAVAGIEVWEKAGTQQEHKIVQIASAR